jgi:hypothetical protein
MGGHRGYVLHSANVANARLGTQPVVAETLRDAYAVFCLSAADYHMRTGLRERARDPLTDPHCRPGYKRNLASEIERVCAPARCCDSCHHPDLSLKHMVLLTTD